MGETSLCPVRRDSLLDGFFFFFPVKNPAIRLKANTWGTSNNELGEECPVQANWSTMPSPPWEVGRIITGHATLAGAASLWLVSSIHEAPHHVPSSRWSWPQQRIEGGKALEDRDAHGLNKEQKEIRRKRTSLSDWPRYNKSITSVTSHQHLAMSRRVDNCYVWIHCEATPQITWCPPRCLHCLCCRLSRSLTRE